MNTMRRKRSLTVEPLEGRALLSAVVTPVTHAPALVQTVNLNQKLYAICKGVLDTVYNDVKEEVIMNAKVSRGLVWGFVVVCLCSSIAVAQEKVYTGTMRIRCAAPDGWMKPSVFRHSVKVVVAPPMYDGSMRDSNPFSLIISSSEGTGDLWVTSAIVATTPTARSVALQYWDLAYDGHRLGGILKHDHIDKAAAGNILTLKKDIAGVTEMDWPFPIEVGAALGGTLDDRRAKIRVSGKASSDVGQVVFSADIDAVRSE